MEFKDYYEALGVPRDASLDDIKRAYRKLARQHHPDISKEAGAEERFKEISEAYEVLKDPEKRAAYDQVGQGFQAGQDFRPPPGWDAGFEFSERGGGRAEEADLSDFFETLFGHARRGGGQGGGSQTRHEAFRQSFHARGQDHHAKALIELEDAYRGAERTVSLRAPELTEDGHLQLKERALKVRIPKGVREGQHLRLAGQGGPGMGDAPAGDLYIEIAFAPHGLYRVEGKDVLLDLPVAPWEAALGAKVRVPTPEGPVSMQVPAGSTGGRRLRLKGRGIPGDPPGDLYAVLHIVLPPADSEEAKEAYREMERKLAFDPRANLGGGKR